MEQPVEQLDGAEGRAEGRAVDGAGGGAGGGAATGAVDRAVGGAEGGAAGGVPGGATAGDALFTLPSGEVFQITVKEHISSTHNATSGEQFNFIQ